MSERVPEGWKLLQLGDVANISSGGTPSRSNPANYIGEIPWVKSGEVNQRKVSFTEEKISEQALKSSSAKWVKSGSVLVAMYGATAGKVAKLLIDATINQAIAAVCSYKEEAANDFLFHAMEFNAARLLNTVQGSGQPNLSGQLVKELKVPIPPLPEQKKIASILTSVDEVIENTQKQIDKLQDLKKATMNELLTKGIGHTEFKDGELGRIPKSWKIVTIDSVTSSIKSGLSRRLSSQDIGIPVINSGNIVSRGLDTKELKYWYLDDPQGANIENYLLQDGDILLNFINSVSQIGKSCIYKSIGRDCIYTTNLFCIRVGKKISSSFLHSLMRQEKFRKEISLITKPAVNQASFTKEDLSNLIILLPTLEEQNLIMKSLDAIDENIINHHHKLETFQSIKKSLMQELLTGKVRVQIN